MKCDSCQNCKLSVDGIYYYCTCQEVEIDKDAAIINCDDYVPYESDVSEHDSNAAQIEMRIYPGK